MNPTTAMLHGIINQQGLVLRNTGDGRLYLGRLRGKICRVVSPPFRNLLEVWQWLH